MASSSARAFPSIKAIRTYVVDGVGSGGDYHNVEGGHWYVAICRRSCLQLTCL